MDLLIPIILGLILIAMGVGLWQLHVLRRNVIAERQMLEAFLNSPAAMGPSQADIARAVRQEMARQQRSIDRMADGLQALERAMVSAPQDTQSDSDDGVSEAADNNDPGASMPPVSPPARITEQPGLPLENPMQAASRSGDWGTVLRALNFPKDDQDEAGFAALNLALQDPDLAKLLRSAEDVLNLLAQLGVYMDDVRAAPVPLDYWKARAAGKRDMAPARLDGARAPAAQAKTGRALEEDPILRDAARHFMRQFDGLLITILEDAPTEDLERLAETRSGRAFLLFARAFST